MALTSTTVRRLVDELIPSLERSLSPRQAARHLLERAQGYAERVQQMTATVAELFRIKRVLRGGSQRPSGRRCHGVA